ncbi:MAG: hypothetical protein RIG63_20495 [Coleofasciculus chthonoplastes F3-SA18-01]
MPRFSVEDERVRSPHLKDTNHNPNPIKILDITSTRSHLCISSYR